MLLEVRQNVGRSPRTKIPLGCLDTTLLGLIKKHYINLLHQV
jgi:hypothetical protein